MDYYVGANVVMSPDVAIAPGVILEAVANGRLVIESGVCLGAGVVIQAFSGTLTLRTGANVGQNVLIVGAGSVGARACIGADSTVINPQVPDQAVVMARSLLGLDSPLPQSSLNSETAATPEPLPPQKPGVALSTVYGREQVQQLLQTLFPHRDSLNGQDNPPCL